MPPTEVYAIDFANNETLKPEVDVNGWGNMVFGGSTQNTDSTISEPAIGYGTERSDGLILVGFRPRQTDPTKPIPFVSNSVYVTPAPGMVPLNSRLRMRVEFDLPKAVPAAADVKAEAWAVVLKLASSSDDKDQATMVVTCQFNNQTNGRNGVRLNDPSRAQRVKTNIAMDLDSPLDYERYDPSQDYFGPTRFTLSFAFSGVQGGPPPPVPQGNQDPLGYAVGCGFLEMDSVYGDSPLRIIRSGLEDVRLFSSTTLTQQSWISALGVSLMTESGVGTFRARLRRFSIETWERGKLLSYGDAGTPGNVSAPVIVGLNGWLDFKFLFAGANPKGNCIYAVDFNGKLLTYWDKASPGNVSDYMIVGGSGWGNFKFLFAGVNGLGENRIYAVNEAGELLSYGDSGEPLNVSTPVIVGSIGWADFKFLFAGVNPLGSRIFAVDRLGRLLSFQDDGSAGNVNVLAPMVVGDSGWADLSFLFAGKNGAGENRIYAVDWNGKLLAFWDDGGLVLEHVIVGFAGWSNFKFLFAGMNDPGENRIYAVVP